MSLSGSVKHVELEPVYYNANQRVEFRLHPDKLYSTDLILSNLGVSRAANQGRLNKWCGVYGTITNLTLFDGNTELSNLTDLGRWGGFKMANKSNQYNNSVASYYHGCDGTSHIMTLTDRRDQQAGGLIGGEKVMQGDTRVMATTAGQVGVNGTFKGLLRLRQMFDLLSSMQYIDTSVFRNFRIVCELSNAPNRIVGANQNVANLTTTRPLLVAQEIVDEDILDSAMGKMGNVVYTEIENDLVQIPTGGGLNPAAAAVPPLVTNVAGGRYATQRSNFHINAFDNKTLGRMLLWKQPSVPINQNNQNNGDAGKGLFSSSGFLGEKAQVKINGRNVFARSGVEGDNRRLAHMVDSWGVMALAPMQYGLGNQSPDATLRQGTLQDGNEVIGNLSFVGLDLGNEKCQDLQIDFERTIVMMATQAVGGGNGGGIGDTARTANSKYNAAHDLAIWCEVKKAIVPNKDGSYNVVYV